ncbi:MAG: hypothetical protein KC766_02600, partial [Myxococcales bacterium]|nr:hypothetical protein [Myxococcales bacterium]
LPDHQENLDRLLRGAVEVRKLDQALQVLGNGVRGDVWTDAHFHEQAAAEVDNPPKPLLDELLRRVGAAAP